MISTSLSSADVSHLTNAQYYGESTTTLSPPPRPYAFSYQAGRFRGHIDRTHSEVSDGSGVVHGTFSYIDPRQEIRSVEYFATKDGFHPVLSHQNEEPQQSEAVRLATVRHFEQYNRIAEQNANVSIIRISNYRNYYLESVSIYLAVLPQGNIFVPADSAAVARAKERHHTLFEQISQEHQRIGAELEAKRALFESTSEKESDIHLQQ